MNDPFSSKFDGLTSIGGLSIVGSVSMGADELFDGGGSENIYFDELAVENSIGCAYCDKKIGDLMGFSVSASVSTLANGAVSELQKKSKAKKKPDDGDKIAEGIRSVTRSPITHAAIGAIAAVAPPASTVVAGLAELGVGLAEGVALVGEIFDEAVDFVSCVFGGDSPAEQTCKRRYEKELETKKKTLEAKYTKLKNGTEGNKRQRIEKEYESKKRELETEWDTKKKQIEKAFDGSTKKGKEFCSNMRSIEKASSEIAKIRKAAKAGDPSAQKKIIALQFLTDKEMLFARANLKGKAAGVSDKVLKKASEDAIFHALKGWGQVVKRSAEIEKTLPKPKIPASVARKMPDLKKTRGIIRNGAKVLLSRTAKAEKKRGKGVNGIFVSRVGEKIKGNFENVLTDKSAKAARGWVVLANGRTVSGRFRALRVR